ncbi:MAG: hypothetical protein AB7O74_02885 [Candidatus Nanopelagicales bacterium]
MSRYQWRFVWAAAVSWAASLGILWFLTDSVFSARVSGGFVYAAANTLTQITFYLGVLFAGGAVLLAVLRSDRADQYELDSDEPFESGPREPDGPFAGMVD